MSDWLAGLITRGVYYYSQILLRKKNEWENSDDELFFTRGILVVLEWQ